VNDWRCGCWLGDEEWPRRMVPDRVRWVVGRRSGDVVVESEGERRGGGKSSAMLTRIHLLVRG